MPWYVWQVIVVDKEGVPFRKYKRAGGEDGSEALLLEGKASCSGLP